MNLSRVIGAGAAAVAAVTVLGISGGAAHAAPSTVTAHTQVSNRPDGGNGGTWAYDDFTRTLTVTVAAVQNPADTAAHLTDYAAQVTDYGQFNAIVGTLTPDQAVPGAKITGSVRGAMHGSISYTVTAPSADTLTGTVPAAEDDNFGAPATTTSAWPKLAFASPAGVTVTENSDWTWTYTTRCEAWTDSAANGDGNLLADGNITGKSCVPPRHRRDRDDHRGHGHRR